MKILFFASDYKIGLSTLLSQQAIAYNKEGLDMICVAGEEDQEVGLTQWLSDNSIRLIRVNGLDKYANFSTLSKEIESIVDENGIQCIHVQNNWQLGLVAYLKYKSITPKKIKIVATLHGFRNDHPVKSVIAVILIGSSLLLFVDKIFIMSDFIKKRFRLLSYKMRKLYLGVDDMFFEKQENKMDVDNIRMIFPAQFRHGKNQHVLIKALSSYVKQTSDLNIELYLPGKGDQMEEMKRLSQKLEVETIVKFPGYCTRKQLLELYEKCNVGVIPSTSETFGQCIVEPYVLGKCVISRRVGVASEIIVEGENGFFFNTENDLTGILIKLAGNKEKIREAGNINFSKRDTFRWYSIAKEYVKELNSL